MAHEALHDLIFESHLMLLLPCFLLLEYPQPTTLDPVGAELLLIITFTIICSQIK